MLLSLAQATAGSGVRHSAVCLSGRSGALTDEFANAGVTESLCGVKPLWSFPVRLRGRLRRMRPDVVVSHVSLASGLVLALAALSGIRVRVALFHSDGDGRAVGGLRRAYRSIMRLLLRLTATHIVGVTPSTLGFAGLATSPRALVIPNAVDVDHFAPEDRDSARGALDLPLDADVVLHAGRAAPEKNRQALVPILRCLDDQTHLLMAGADTTEDLNVADGDLVLQRISNHGPVADIRPLLAACDVVLLPSVREGLPMVVLEALAAGRPVVATDLPGLRSIAGTLPDLYLVPSGFDPADFAAAVARVLENRRTPDKIHATVAGSQFDLKRVAERWTRLCSPSA